MSFDGRSRRVYLVGTVPGANTREALGLVLDSVGDRLPDGETGERGDWIGRLVEGLREHRDLELVRDGDLSDYESTPVFRVRRGHRFTSVDLDYYDAFTSSWPDFLEARRQLGRNDLTFQVGIPGPIDVAFAAFGFNPLRGLRHTAPFEEATVVEIERIHAEVGDEVVYQADTDRVGNGDTDTKTATFAWDRLAGPADPAGGGTLAGVHPVRIPPLCRRHEQSGVQSSRGCRSGGGKISTASSDSRTSHLVAPGRIK